MGPLDPATPQTSPGRRSMSDSMSDSLSLSEESGVAGARPRPRPEVVPSPRLKKGRRLHPGRAAAPLQARGGAQSGGPHSPILLSDETSEASSRSVSPARSKPRPSREWRFAPRRPQLAVKRPKSPVRASGQTGSVGSTSGSVHWPRESTERRTALGLSYRTARPYTWAPPRCAGGSHYAHSFPAGDSPYACPSPSSSSASTSRS